MDANGSLFIAILAGDSATTMASWLRNEQGMDDSISIPDVPVICFSSADPSNFQVASWTFGTLHMDKTVSTKWSWGKGRNQLPPQPSFTYRMFQLGVIIGPKYRCVGFSNTGVPQLDLNHCTGDGGHWILMQAQVVQIAEVLQGADGQKRKFEPTFPTQACHLHPHNHRENGDDDSPPPQGKRVRL